MRVSDALRAKLESPYVETARVLIRTLVSFAGVSGIGLALDFSIFQSLVLLGLHPSSANAISSAAGITFVYFASVRRIFKYEGHFLIAKWLTYICYEALLIAIVSITIGRLSEDLHAKAWLIKIGVTPLTFLANFIFMSWLTGYFDRRARAIP